MADREMKQASYKRKFKKAKRYVGTSTSSSSISRGLAASVPGPETKAIDIAPIASTNLDSTGSVVLLNGSVPGVQSYQRIGRRVTCKSITIRLGIHPTALGPAGGYAFDFARILVVYDRQTNGALPLYSDVLQDTLTAGGLANTALSNVNINNTKRFRILRDINRVFGPFANAAAGGASVAGAQWCQDWQPMSHKLYIKLPNLTTEFNAGVAGTVADVSTGGIFLVFLGMAGAGVNSFACRWASRVRFCDL